MKMIEITTAQKVTIQYELASIGNRAMAFFIDAMVVVGVAIILAIVFSTSMRGANGQAILYFMVGIVVAFYNLLSEILLDGQSIGKRSMGIKVVKLNGDAPTAYDFFVRWVFRFVDTLLSFGALAALMVSSSSKSQRVGDMLAGTTVIRQTSSRIFSLADILKIASIENYTVSYEKVRRLSESDMLFVKQVLERERRYNNPAHQKAVANLAEHLAVVLDIDVVPVDKRQFLRTLLNDYIVLTR
jgi:uncharacterized RDD family membrane protein YckC